MDGINFSKINLEHLIPNKETEGILRILFGAAGVIEGDKMVLVTADYDGRVIDRRRYFMEGFKDDHSVALRNLDGSLKGAKSKIFNPYLIAGIYKI